MELKRSLNLWLTLTYGLGTILGAGIYVLVGKVAGYAGFFAPLAFLLASVVAGFTAYSYSHLCARHPKAAGEAVYVHEAFHKRWLTSLTGWFVVLTGISSAAALTRGFAGYFQILLPLPDMLIVLILVILVCLLASWGIGQSAIAAMIITLIELAGLILVIGAASLR